VLGNILFQLAIYGQNNTVQRRNQQAAFKTVQAAVTVDAADWQEPAWQNKLSAKVTAWGGAVQMQDANGRAQFQEGVVPAADQPIQVIVLMDGTRRVGTVKLFSPVGWETSWFFTRIGLTLFLVLLPSVIVGWFLGRMVLQPLAAMSQAARQIAGGNLDFNLPASRVHEVAEVSTAFHAMGDALRIALERQAELEQERRLFISAIAHDLRTPLFSLRGYLEGLVTGVAATAEKRAHYLTVCQEQATLLEQRIAALFAYARLEYLEQTPRRAPLDFGLLLQQTIARLQPLLDDKQVTVQLTSTEATCSLQADAQLLTRVLENLLDNALRYTPSGEVIQVSWHKEAERLCFTIADSGPGIAPADLPHVFAPLYRGALAENRQTDGAGLGLTIAQRILQAHGGGLAVTNRTMGGAAFAGWLPL